eukprot:c20135_g1_i3.p1 GENE.c20135_g1_i3~~c20135_g1_i3.p1  ORF type:complete len:732 (+),score=164.30 c20135_g1_i3:30-2198(+)
MSPEQQASAVACVVALTHTTEQNARQLLMEADWNVDNAVNAFYDTKSAEAIAAAGGGDEQDLGLEAPIVLSDFDQSVDTFCSLTGASSKTAFAMLEQHRQSIHQALNAYFEIEGQETELEDEDLGTELEYMSETNSVVGDLSAPVALPHASARSSPLIPPNVDADAFDVTPNGLPTISAPLPVPKAGVIRSRIRSPNVGFGGDTFIPNAGMRQVGHHPSIQAVHRISTPTFKGQTFTYNQLATRGIVVNSRFPPETHGAIEVHIMTNDGERFDITALRHANVVEGPVRVEYRELQTSLMRNEHVILAGMEFDLKPFVTILERRFIARLPQVLAPNAQQYCAGPLLLAVMGRLTHQRIDELSSADWLRDLPTLCVALDARSAELAVDTLENQIDDIVRTFKKRTAESKHLAQAADFISASNTCSSKILDHVTRIRDARDVFTFAADSLWGRSIRKSVEFFSESDAEEVSKDSSYARSQVKMITKLPWQLPVEGAVFHPFNFEKQVDLLTVESLFKSKTRPAFVTLTCNGEVVPPRIILKRGDDIRQDAVALALFSVMNSIWDSEKLRYHAVPVVAPTFRCVAMDDSFGCYECVDQSSTLKTVDFETLIVDEERRRRLIATAAGSYMAAYVLGVRDRHNENILVTSDASVFHIDFSHILGNSIRLDTGPFAITATLKKAMGDSWEVRPSQPERNSIQEFLIHGGLGFVKCLGDTTNSAESLGRV